MSGGSISSGFPIWVPPTRLSVTRNRSAGNAIAFCNDGRADTMGLRARLAVVASDIAGRAVLRTHQSHRRLASAGVRWSCWGWLRSEPVDAVQDVGEQVTRDGDLGHLEDDVAAMAHDLRSVLYELLPQRRQRPLLYGIG